MNGKTFCRRYSLPAIIRSAAIVRQVDGRERCAPVDRREPAGVAVGQHVHRIAPAVLLSRSFDQRQTVFTDGAAGFDVFVTKAGGALVGARFAIGRWYVAQRSAHLVESPTQIRRRGPRREQFLDRVFERRVGGVLTHLEAHTVCSGHPDQRRSANTHRTDRFDCVCEAVKLRVTNS